MRKTAKVFIIIILIIFSMSLTFFSVAATNVDVGNHILVYVKNKKTGKYLTVAPGNNVVQSKLNYDEFQRFFIDQAATVGNTKYYTLSLDANTSLKLHIAGAEDQNHANVMVHIAAEPYAQQFRFIEAGSRAYKIMPRLSSTRILDVQEASLAEDANIQLYTYRTDSSDVYYNYQSWILESVEKSIINDWMVDSGKHLDWNSDSAYENLIPNATNIWNSYKQGVIRKDNLLRILDVTITDINIKSDFAAHTDFPESKIELNLYHFGSYDTNIKTNVIAHELGHVLGIGHINSPDGIMGLYANSILTLDDPEKDSYDESYTRY